MKNVVTSVAEVAGATCVSIGAFMVAPAAGFGVVGVFLLAFSRAVVRR